MFGPTHRAENNANSKPGLPCKCGLKQRLILGDGFSIRDCRVANEPLQDSVCDQFSARPTIYSIDPPHARTCLTVILRRGTRAAVNAILVR